MIGMSYQASQDIIHTRTIHIEDVIKENARLTIKLSKADADLGKLRLEIKRLQEQQNALSIKLQDAENEVSRLYMVVRHQEEQSDWLQRHPQVKSYP